MQGLLGPSYLVNLSSKAPLLYSNILGLTGSTLDLRPLFTLKLSLVAFLVGISIKVWKNVNRGNGYVPRYTLALGPSAIIVAMIGEFMNDAGRYPYLLILGNTGLSPGEFMNVYVVLAFVGVFMVKAYYALNKRFLSDLPE